MSYTVSMQALDSLSTQLHIDYEISRYEGTLSKSGLTVEQEEDVYYADMYTAEQEAENAWERYYHDCCSNEYAVIERDAPWAL